MREIPLTQGKVALVDDEDFENLSKYNWCARECRNRYYAVRNSPRDVVTHKQHNISMHRSLINTPEGMETDHINGNSLDNQKENLRVVTTRENQQNLHVEKISKYPGVSWYPKTQKWGSHIKINKKKRHLGYYSDEEMAGLVYAMACNAIKMGCVL
jgi:hypothetical protein